MPGVFPAVLSRPERLSLTLEKKMVETGTSYKRRKMIRKRVN